MNPGSGAMGLGLIRKNQSKSFFDEFKLDPIALLIS
jgi:hypothetical protein